MGGATSFTNLRNQPFQCSFLPLLRGKTHDHSTFLLTIRKRHGTTKTFLHICDINLSMKYLQRKSG